VHEQHQMELHVVDTEGIPEGCVLSVRAGSTRRQAPVAADRPFRFPTSAEDATPFKVDVLEPVASARLVFRPGEEKRPNCQYTINLESTKDAGKGDAPIGSEGLKVKESSAKVVIAVRPTDDPGDGKGDDEGDGSRPGTSTKKGAAGGSTSLRHGQANAAREYLDKHNLVEFTQLLVQSVIKEQPERPYAFMARQFYFPDPEPLAGSGEGGGGGGEAPPSRSGATR